MKKTIFLILISLFFIACNNETTVYNDSAANNTETNQFIGHWKCVERAIPYSAYLIINSDSTFRYDFGACMMRGFSEGIWILDNDTIILSSNGIDSCLRLSHFGVDCIQISVDDTTERHPETTIMGCDPYYSPVDYVEFDNEAFYLDGDTLRHIIKQPKLCPDIRNDFFKPEKKIPLPVWILGTWHNSAESNTNNFEYWTFKNDSILVEYGFPIIWNNSVYLNDKFFNYHIKTDIAKNTYKIEFLNNDEHIIYEFILQEVSYEDEPIISYSLTVNGEIKRPHSTSCNLVLTRLK